MLRSALCIKMLMILYSHDIVKIEYLAKELDTNDRNIPEFKKELEAAGYVIESVRGKYGGYRLKKNNLFPTVRLSEAEKKALVESFEYVIKRGELPSMPAYKNAMEIIIAANRCRTAKDSELIMIPKYPLAMSEDELQERYSALLECADRRIAIKIHYLSNDNVVRERVIHPYKLYMYNNAWFTLAYCESANDIRYFKLNRIEAFEVTSKRFVQIYSYREGGEHHEWLSDGDMKKVPDWSGDIGGEDASMRIKLRLSGKPAMYAKQYLYGTDQVITAVDKDTTLLEFTGRYKYNVLQLVLGFGADCEVLEPDWLKDEIVSQAEKMKAMYAKK